MTERATPEKVQGLAASVARLRELGFRIALGYLFARPGRGFPAPIY